MTAWRRSAFELSAAELERVEGEDIPDGVAEEGADDGEAPREPTRSRAEYAVRLLDAALLRIDAAVTITADDDPIPLPALLELRDRALGR